MLILHCIEQFIASAVDKVTWAHLGEGASGRSGVTLYQVHRFQNLMLLKKYPLGQLTFILVFALDSHIHCRRYGCEWLLEAVVSRLKRLNL